MFQSSSECPRNIQSEWQQKSQKKLCCHGLRIRVRVSFQILSTHLHCESMRTFLPPPPKRRTIVLALPLASHTSLYQQLWNLASDATDITHGYQTWPLVYRIFFSEDRCLNGCNISFSESQVEDYLEFQVP